MGGLALGRDQRRAAGPGDHGAAPRRLERGDQRAALPGAGPNLLGGLAGRRIGDAAGRRLVRSRRRLRRLAPGDQRTPPPALVALPVQGLSSKPAKWSVARMSALVIP